MKRYIDAELLKREIESLKSLEYPCDNSEQNFGFEYALDRLSDSLDSLQQEQPSGDLEEAAENYIAPIENEEGLYYFNFCGRDIKGAFIAGAEWQKEQMLKEAVEGEAEELYNDGEIHCTVGVGTYFKPGDEVYVIKKKD